MKGNQGLEALAALCGGQAAAVASTTSSSGAFATTSAAASGASDGASVTDGNIGGGVTNVTGDANKAGAATTASSCPTAVVPAPNAAQESTPSGTTGGTSPSSTCTSSPETAGTATNQLSMRQAAEQLAATTASGVCGEAAAAGTTTATNNNNNVPVAAPAPATTVTPQQWSQALAVAANLRAGTAAGGIDPAMAQSLLFSAGFNPAAHQQQAHNAPGLASINNSTNNNGVLASTMQQFAIQQYIQAAKAQQQQVQAQAAAAAAAAAAATHPLFAMALAAGKAGHLLPNASAPSTTTTTTGPPDASTSTTNTTSNASCTTSTATSTSAPINPTSTSSTVPGQHQYQVPLNPVANGVATTGGAAASTGAIQHPPSLINLAAAGGRILPSSAIPKNKDGTVQDSETSTPSDRMGAGDKKQQKRAANRRSAQLSRKRKKQFIEELKEENEDLRRKEQILRAIPDLIVVFDSSGKLGFVSESVGRFLDLSPDKLEGTSFWDLICEDSVRLLKAAFMDSLAVREPDSDTSMLGDGQWELRLKNNDSKYMLVTLNGVVHFKGDAPECVCCIRPLSEHQHKKQNPPKQQQQTTGVTVDTSSNNNSVRDDVVNNKDKNTNRAVSCSDGDASRISYGSNGTQQSVLSPRELSLAVQEQAAVDAKSRSKIFRRGGVMAGEDNNSNNGEADGTNNSVRISDGDSIDGLESDEA